MGLDQYLYLRKRTTPPTDDKKIGYWRKANAIHKWFVDNVQGGKDDCGEYVVTKDQLLSLGIIIKEVLKKSKLVVGDIVNGQKMTDKGWEDILEKGFKIDNPTIAHKLLPTSKGFFFGSQGYDQYYVEDLNDTLVIIDEALKEDGELYYTSSW